MKCSKQKLCQDDCSFCFERSFASHPKAVFWDQEKNEKNPFEVTKNSNSKFWFKCLLCKHDFEISLDHVSSGRWCPYCAIPSRKLCNCDICFERSFASHPKAVFWNEEKNQKSPYQVFKTTRIKFWFICVECAESFFSRVANVTRNSWCPSCTRKTENLFSSWLKLQGILFEREKKFDWCKNDRTKRFLPFDFYLSHFNAIIEIDGNQHVREVKFFKSSLEKIQKADRFKESKAVENGIPVVSTSQEDILKDKINWKGLLSSTLAKTLKSKARIWFISSPGFYFT